MPSASPFRNAIATGALAGALCLHTAPALTATALAAPVSPAPRAADPVDALFRRTLREERIPGLALLVMREGRVLRLGTWGYANLEHDVPVRRDTLFQSGSLGKQFTAFALLQLAARGQVDLDAPVSRYLPAGPPPWAPITVRQLLEHTSGIHDSEEDNGEVFDLRREYSDDEIIAIAQSWPLNFAPGTKWRYNNMGYVLGGIIITRVTGRFYGDFLAQEIFRPLGMRTARIISDADIVPHRAAGYVRTADGLRNQDYASASLNATADGSLYLSLDDWSAWVAAMDRGALLPAAAWSALWTPIRLADGTLTEHGYCWDHVRAGAHDVLEFDGSWQGFRSAIARDPESRTTVVVLANLAQAEPVPLARAALAHAAHLPPY